MGMPTGQPPTHPLTNPAAPTCGAVLMCSMLWTEERLDAAMWYLLVAVQRSPGSQQC
jgi:hypothetical protein